ncbi:hypothetical protein E0F88_32945 [Dyadobacter psychrotolerans]|uniref:Glycosyltransferase RgtA/B/C/D-like domain-containing protein n=2 Tax=Dyadobacter psychrotolerans TaxID=2541721 RepID=A0A4R5D990_9BACT|nr:hypothetical protein E0F88_32945 [Dyadobacter psychrotolerans]
MKLRFLPAICICLVIFNYILYNHYYSVNFPYQDDFLLIQFIEAVAEGEIGFKDLVTELFRTFNDHKAVVPRLIALIQYKLIGCLNFRFYIALVSLNVTYIFYFIYLQYRKTKLPLYYFIPAAFLYFQPLYYEISGWALTGMQHSFLTAFTATAVILASQRTNMTLFGAMLCCLLATFTHGNGILSFPAIIVYFLIFKDIKPAIISGAFMVLCLVIYLAGYESGQAVQLPKNLTLFFQSLFGLIGSSMSLWAFPLFSSFVWGAIIVCFLLYVMWQAIGFHFNKLTKIRPGTAELLALFVFILLTSSVIALFRSWAGSTLASRFQIYASLSTVIFYVLLLQYTRLFRRQTVFYTVTLLSVFYCLYSYYKFTGIVANRRTTYLADVYNWKHNRNMLSVEETITKNGAFYLNPGYEKGFFKLPDAIVERYQLDSMFRAPVKTGLNNQLYVEDWRVERAVRNGVEKLTYSYVASNAFPQRKPLSVDRFLILKNRDTGVFHLACANPKVEARKQILTAGHYFKPGFNTLFRQDDLTTGTYDLGVLDVANNGQKTFYRLDKSLIADKGYTLQ